MNDEKIKMGLAAKRERAALQTQREIVIPAGTLLRAIGDDKFCAAVGFGPGCAGVLTVTAKPGEQLPADALKRVVAA